MAGQRKARVPVQSRGIETRSKIIDSGMYLFGKKGYHKTNAVEIAAHAGIGTGTFYSYFNNKKEVLTQGIKRFYQQVTAIILNAVLAVSFEPSNIRETICILIRTLVSAHEIDPDLHKQISAMILLDKDIEDLCAKEDMTVINLIKMYLETHKDLFLVTDYEAAATTILRVCDEIVHRVKVFKTTIAGERLINELEDIMCRYLLKD
ncbi:MAG: TetR/AcrR family transcriptional regulator [Proteobacteria bacterium]|nr:TetR/AcrR family transcriptional regulator [Pseudomonadota bacterium]